jgi:tetraacyldisaccharide 4'-kinase
MAPASPRPWLAPLGALMGGAAALRAALYRRGVFSQARLRGPVISVGNLRVGGSGKTPVVAFVARLLLDTGQPVSILSRGYRGSFRGSHLLVSDGTSVLADAALAGDEPVMLARQLPGAVIAVGPHRDAVGRAVEERFGPRVHVLDDGFQHLRLGRNLDIVCITASDLADRPLPAGWLREGRAALARADVVLLAGDCPTDDVLRQLGPDRAFVVRRRTRGFFTSDGQPQAAPRRVFLLSGIARPERFAGDVTAAGVEVAGHAACRDHHVFTPGEIEAAGAHAMECGAEAVVTTEKDAVRLRWRGALPLLVLGIEVEVEDGERFRSRILGVLGSRPA